MQPHRASSTARLIALSTVFLSHQPRDRDLLPPEAAALSESLLTRTAPLALRLIRALSRPGARGLVLGFERLVLPGIQRHYAARKRYIEDAARAFLAGAGGQLLVIGAGLDTLATRIARDMPDIRCVELDHPATSALKRDAMGGDVPANLVLVPLDLGRSPWAEAEGIDPALPTFVVLEGVTMYLTEQAVEETLQGCARMAPGSQLVWTFMHPDARGHVRFHQARAAVSAWLASRREPFTWGLALGVVPEFLAPLGLEPQEIVTATQLRARYLDPRGIDGALAQGEALCLTRTTE
ncbi:class I SAM-dependent methyltransferase [uncultured Serinicoccus sp.]|uniref:class I SAM-dependent methyltransferase n=1 Tax=uncultured Serinicoccus sp. TaxID=735514 RepID=UPI002633922E|nr:class I SAM-dependent methyltransferase [uncultured Serinicoccus sp.]